MLYVCHAMLRYDVIRHFLDTTFSIFARRQNHVLGCVLAALTYDRQDVRSDAKTDTKTNSSSETITKTQARFYRKAFLPLNTTKSPPYHHPTVRDLYWLVNAEPLFTRALAGFKPFELEIDPERFTQFCLMLEQHPAKYFEKHHIARSQYRRLGLYFEALLRFLFSVGTDFGVCPWQLLEHNVQMKRHGITSGEIDLLLQHRSGELVHVEVAVKYYLARQVANEWQNWIGPNARDRLDIKMRRLLHHQLPLLTLPESRPTVTKWRANYQNTKTSDTFQPQPTISSRFLIKGMLFRHLVPSISAAPAEHQTPTESNTLAPFGYWCKENELLALADEIPKWWPCEKMEWLSGPDLDQHRPLNTTDLVASLQLQTLEREAVDSNKANNKVNSKDEKLEESGKPNNEWEDKGEDKKEALRIFVPLLCYGLKHGQLYPIMIVDNHWPE